MSSGECNIDHDVGSQSAGSSVWSVSVMVCFS
jgi:hypothetical protein